ncbi:MAG: PA2169 family four-helix-bundle protein [Bacteroidota bacterium]|nr:PA2169 family four-helix-bundle protein [Bacteroidota bacterium]
MESNNEKLVSNIEHLISIAEDGKKGYENAAEDAQDGSLKAMFQKYATQRGTYSTDLKRLTSELGGDPDKEAGVMGSMHRAWMDIRTWLGSNENATVLKECVTGENAAIKSYTEAIEDADANSMYSSILNEQLNGVRGALSEIKTQITHYDPEYNANEENDNTPEKGGFSTGSHNAPYDLNDKGSTTGSEYKY